MASVTLTTLRQRLLRELDLGWLITNADVTSFAAGSITSTNMLRNTNTSAGYYKGQKVVIFRPGAASAADYIRYAGILTRTSGLLAHTGANYSDTTVGAEAVELWKFGIRPTRELVDSLNRALEFEFQTSHHMFSHGSRFDFSMEATTDTDWSNVGSPTTTDKTTSQALQSVLYGPRAYRITNANANEGTRTATVVVNQSRQASAFAIVAADVGTASFQLRDITNSADIGTAVTHSYRRPMLVTLRNQDIPATCEAVRLTMLGLESSADIYWNMVSLYVHDSLTMRLPLFISEGFMAPRLFQGIPRTQIADNVYDAGSLDFIPLTEGVDYWPIFNQGDASQYRVRFRDSSLYNWPIFIEYQRPMSDLTTFAEDETATTNIAIHNVLPRWKMDVLNTILLGKIPKNKWNHLYEVAQSELISAKAARPIKSIGNPLPYYSPRNTGHLY